MYTLSHCRFQLKGNWHAMVPRAIYATFNWSNTDVCCQLNNNFLVKVSFLLRKGTKKPAGVQRKKLPYRRGLIVPKHGKTENSCESQYGIPQPVIQILGLLAVYILLLHIECVHINIKFKGCKIRGDRDTPEFNQIIKICVCEHFIKVLKTSI